MPTTNLSDLARAVGTLALARRRDVADGHWLPAPDDDERVALAREAGMHLFDAGVTCDQLHELVALDLTAESDLWSSLVDGWYDAKELDERFVVVGTCEAPGCKALVEGSRRCFVHAV